MLLVSSLDVFDCCGLEMGGECSHPDPDRTEDGRKDSGMICLTLLGSPGSPPLPRNMQGQGMGANLARFWEHRQTQPWFWASTPSQMDRKRDDRYSDEEFGEPEDTAVLWGSPPHAAQASCSQGHWLGRFRSLGSLYLTLTCFREAQEATDRCPGKDKRDIGGGRAARWQLVVRGKGRLPRSFPCSPPRVQPRRAWCPQIIETTSSVPPGELALCVWVVNPPPSPDPTLPRGTERQGRIHVPTMEAEKRESVLYTVLI